MEHKATSVQLSVRTMEVQELNHLSEGPETFTPLKAQSFPLAEDQDEDILEKIPHGLTAKKNRRKSFHQGTSKQREFELTPQRAPLTAPRPNVLNSRPIGLSPMNSTKRSLINQLKAVKAGKENSLFDQTNFDSLKLGNDVINVSSTLEFTTPLSPEKLNGKRRSSVNEPEPNYKHQRVENFVFEQHNQEDELISAPEHSFTLFGGETLGDQANEEGEKSNLNSDLIEPEELSRIDAFDHEVVEPHVTSTQNNETQTFVVASKTPITPSRFTEPIAISPKTEQCSRLVDESGLLLDTSKSPLVDDSNAALDSPLSLHNSSIVDPNNKNVLESLEELDDQSEDILHEYSARLSTPKSRPFFTIAQVHEIQSDFKREASKLEDNIKEKSVRILALNDEISDSKKRIFQLQDELGVISVQKMQIIKENDLLKKEFEVFKNDISDMESTIRAKEGKLSRHQVVITKFKERVKELNDNIRKNAQQLEELKKENDNYVQLEEHFKSRCETYEKQIHHLSFTLEIDSKEKKSIEEKLEFAEQEIGSLKTEIQALAVEKETLFESLTAAEQRVKEKEDQIAESAEKFQNGELGLRDLQIENNALVDKLASLTQSMELSNSRLIEVGSEKDASQRRLEQEIKHGLLAGDIISGMKGALSTLQRDILGLKAAEADHLLLINKLTTDVDDSNELLTIRKAEVTELNLELEQAKKEMNSLQSIIEEKNYHISQLNETILESSDALNSKNSKIQELHEEIQKQEGEHLTELESFHEEMSNVQSLLSSKSNEAFKLREERDTLQREHDLLKYDTTLLKEELSASDLRVSNLKLKLNDSKTKCQELEELVQNLKNEKSLFEKDTEKRLQQLAEDLYIQYSKKHEQKVQVLKKNYENKWQNKVNKAEVENERLRREIEGLNSQLEREKTEKNKIIKLWDQFKEKEGDGLNN